MDRWLRESAAEQSGLNRLRLWCATSADGDFVEYYALAMHAVMPDDAPALARKRERHAIPAIYLTALAVSKAHQGQSIGTALLGDAIARCVSLSTEIGTAAIILDVLKDTHYERRSAFYLSLGFAPIGGDNPGRLFLSIKDALATLMAEDS